MPGDGHLLVPYGGADGSLHSVPPATKVRDRPSPWPTVLLCGLVWAPLAIVSLIAPWFVVFALMAWITGPVIVLVMAGLAALVPSLRAGARATVRGVALSVGLGVIPSMLVVCGAFAQMSSDYF
jgi:hypothetical protein